MDFFHKFDVVDLKLWMSNLEWTVAVTVVGCMFLGYTFARVVEKLTPGQKAKEPMATVLSTKSKKPKSSPQDALDAEAKREAGLAEKQEGEEGDSGKDDNGWDYNLDHDLEHVPFQPTRLTDEEMIERSARFYEAMNQRRSVRFISSDLVPEEVIQNVVRTAGTSPSGAHTEPWTYVVVQNPETKAKVREIIEAEEYINYARRMGEQWVKDLNPLKTTWSKPYLTDAPYIILLFRQMYSIRKNGRKQTHYYNEMSTAISAGFLLLALQDAGLVTVTTTPMNCGPKLRDLLGRPTSEKLILLFPVGFPKKDATIPDLHRKPISKTMVII